MARNGHITTFVMTFSKPIHKLNFILYELEVRKLIRGHSISTYAKICLKIDPPPPETPLVHRTLTLCTHALADPLPHPVRTYLLNDPLQNKNVSNTQTTIINDNNFVYT